ncbi:phospholipase A1 VesT1.02-like isoform X2 [Galleria mellonella]|uniref:Phospholipase A1 VesT1.02-like isoform X2 n=1 Tax=Galleria mellonella TaxID=7137 RepID=A0ABM3MTP6_GALME|nr:phospholipase A1 VesT1.02-like isoform X2 [Galleria mellonella]
MCRTEKYWLWSFVVAFFFVQIAQCANLRCYKGSLDNYITSPLENVMFLANSSCIDPTLPTVIYTFGYRGRVDGPATKALISAYLTKKKRNVVLLDWEEEAKSGFFGIPLGYIITAVPRAMKLGDSLGDALVNMAHAGFNMTQVHLLGHSLGAHVMGFAGKRAREQGYVVSRITGLDPARALFEGSFAYKGLDRTCARFVDIIHSDPGGYGTTKSTGTVDIWPNYFGSGGAQPGCAVGDFDMFTPEDTIDDVNINNGTNYTQYFRMITNVINKVKPNLCNHDRSWQYFAESIIHPTMFPAAAATDYDSWVHSNKSADIVYLGDLTNIRARGNFYLSTNSRPFYGKGKAGLQPNNQASVTRRHLSLSRFLKYLR